MTKLRNICRASTVPCPTNHQPGNVMRLTQGETINVPHTEILIVPGYYTNGPNGPWR
jgi:hypothetical protein